MAEQIKLHTTDLPMVINREFYDDLVKNFTTIEQEMNEFAEMVGDKKSQANFQKQLNELKSRINTVAVGGIDEIALENAVTRVLQQKGVIN